MANSGQGRLKDPNAARRRDRPPGGRIDSTIGTGRAPIRYGYWEPDGQIRATCLLMQGRREFIEKYFETIRDLLDQGFAVFTFDWRGQGRSVRPLPNRHKGHIKAFEDYLADFDLFMRTIVRKKTKAPMMLIGHSMGAHLALRYAHDNPQHVSHLILTAPMVAINFGRTPDAVVRGLVTAACGLGLARRYAPFQHDYDDRCRRFETNRLTSDPLRFADEAYFVDRDEQLAMGGVTFGWLKAALDSIDLVNAAGYPEAIRHPTLIAAAGRDTVVDNDRIRTYAARMRKASLVTIGDAQHEILRETEGVRAMFWRMVDEFLDMAPLRTDTK